MKSPTESEVRQLRDNIYGPQSEKEWQACKHHWLADDQIYWLKRHQPQDVQAWLADIKPKPLADAA